MSVKEKTLAKDEVAGMSSEEEGQILDDEEETEKKPEPEKEK